MEKTRRDVLKLMGAAAGSALLTACGSNLADEPGLEVSGQGNEQFYFVDASERGDDTNPGTTREPLKTLKEALKRSNALPAGVASAIRLRAGGTYSVGTIRKYGISKNKPMTIDRWDEGDAPVISGGLTITGWESVGGGIYKGNKGNRFYSLYIDGEEAPVSTYDSRWLEIEDYRPRPRSDSDEPKPIKEIKLKGVSARSGDLKDARIRVRVNKFTEQADRAVAGWQNGSKWLTLDEPLDVTAFDVLEKDENDPENDEDDVPTLLRQQLKLENRKSFLSEDGDWCCVEENGSYVTYIKGNPSGKEIKGAVYEDLLTLEGTPEYLNINNVRFVMAGRNAITSKVGAKDIRIGNGCSFSRINKAGIYFYSTANDAENITIGDTLSNPGDLDSYMQFDRCGIMVLLGKPKEPYIRFLAGRDIGLTGAAFNDKEERGVFNELNGAVVTAGFPGKRPGNPNTPTETVGGSIRHIHLTNIGGNGVKHSGIGTKITDVEGDKINQRLDDVALVYCWSRSNGGQTRRTEDVTIARVTAKNSSDVYKDKDGGWEGWNYSNPDGSEQAERLRVGVYIDNGVNDSTVEDVTVENCFKGVLVNYFTRNNTVQRNTIRNCQQGIMFHERPSGETLNTGHTITGNDITLEQGDQYAFIFWQRPPLGDARVTFGAWGSNTITEAFGGQETVLLRDDKNPDFRKDIRGSTPYTLSAFEADQCGKAVTCG